MAESAPEIATTDEQMREWRHHLHRHPEIAYSEFETAEFLAARLDAFGIETKRGYGGTGLVGILRAGSSDRSIGLRADMDALPIRELNDFDHKSRNEGSMHACGHDGHMAMLLGAAGHLAAQPQFDGTVYLIFQPAEEAGNGALSMVEDGLFDDCPADAVYGLHNIPGIEVGKFATTPGTMLASMDVVEIEVTGEGGHGAFPSRANNPILPAANVVATLNEQLGSRFAPTDHLVLSICQINGGDAVNVIPETVTLKGTARALTAQAQDKLEEMLPTLVAGICDAYGAAGQVSYRRNYPLLVNTPDETKTAAAAAVKLAGARNVDTRLEPFMASDDFAWLLHHRPGSFMFIGNGVEHNGGCFVHNPHYDFNDDILTLGAKYWVQLVKECLGT